jgi:anti-sigma regulatory factor (Ser/Thr protein kinase)
MTTAVESFVHPALFYRCDEDYRLGLVPFITDGLSLGEPVAVAVPGPNLALLRQALGSDASRVRLLDMTDAGRNPGRIIAGVLRAFADGHPDRHVRIVGEPIWAGRTDSEYPACAQHEALINAAFAGRDVTIVCPYDVTRLEPHVLVDAEATHPVLWDGQDRRDSDRYAPNAVVERYNLPLDNVPDAATCTVTTTTELPRARRFTVEQGRRRGLAPDRVHDLELVATELVTNSLLHANGAGLLRIWSDADHVVCQVSDAGRLTDPLAGRRPPAEGQLGGRGLLLVNEFADLVRVHVGDDGTTIRVYFRRSSG